MKILFVGDYSNLHACLAAELSRQGHYVTVVSDGGAYMRTDSDICLARSPGLRGSISYLARTAATVRNLRGFDVVQIMDTQFLALRPQLIDFFFDRLRRQNGSMAITLASDNYFYLRACTSGALPFSDWRTGSEPTPYAIANTTAEKAWLSKPMEHHARHIFDTVDAAMAVLPEYYIAADPIIGSRLCYTGIPIDLSSHPYSAPTLDGPLRILLGMKTEMALQKGTDRLRNVLQTLQQMRSDIKVDVVSGLPYKEYLLRLKSANIVVDQLHALSPATNALDSMALGKLAASGASSVYYKFIGEKAWEADPDSGPLLRLDPRMSDNELIAVFLSVADNRALLASKAEVGRKLVEHHNDVKLVANRFLDAYQSVS